jgi:hypothetical protein
MKTRILKSIFVMFVTIVSITTVSAQSEFLYDKQYKNDRIFSITKYELTDGGLYAKLRKYEFNYDKQGNLTEKKVSKWDNADFSWVPTYKISIAYKTQDNTVIYKYATWNNNTNAYNPVSKQAIQKIGENNELISIKMLKKERDNLIPYYSFEKNLADLATLTKN